MQRELLTVDLDNSNHEKIEKFRIYAEKGNNPEGTKASKANTEFILKDQSRGIIEETGRSGQVDKGKGDRGRDGEDVGAADHSLY